MSGTRYFPVAAKRRDTMRDTATVTVMALVSGLVVVGRYAPWPLSADIFGGMTDLALTEVRIVAQFYPEAADGDHGKHEQDDVQPAI